MTQIIFLAVILFTAFTFIVHGKVTPGTGGGNCPSDSKTNNGHCTPYWDGNDKVTYSCLDATGGAEIDCKK